MNIEKRRAEIAARKAEIRAFLEADDGKADMDALEKELRELNEEDAALEKRQAVERMLNSGGSVGSPVANPVQRRAEENAEENERLYRSAWLKSLQGKPLTEAEQRARRRAPPSPLSRRRPQIRLSRKCTRSPRLSNGAGFSTSPAISSLPWRT